MFGAVVEVSVDAHGVVGSGTIGTFALLLAYSGASLVAAGHEVWTVGLVCTLGGPAVTAVIGSDA